MSTMSWLDKFKQTVNDIRVGPVAGEWACIAMACVVFADGTAGDPEIEKARENCATNPVVVNTLGPAKGEKLFLDTCHAINTVPSAMLPSYEKKLTALSGKISEPQDRQFALATVLQVAMADGRLDASEHAMLQRFKQTLGVDLEIPAAS